MRTISTTVQALILLAIGCSPDEDGLQTTAQPNSRATVSNEAPRGRDALAQESCGAASGLPHSLTLRGNLGTHDPVILAAGGRYWQFQTGKGVYAKVSKDMISWDPLPSQLNGIPDWLKRQVPGITQDLWAPDISFFGGKYHLYYSGSTYGDNRSCIGHATKTDAANLGNGGWKDENGVICSNTGSNKQDWNAIDPNVIVDEKGTPWMSFGSFWSGIKMIKLTSAGARADGDIISIASRGSGGQIEAPFIIRRCGYYYLFVSFDKCCEAAKSTYRTMVGRSRSVTGPFVDKAGKSMMQGGGTQVVAGDGRWKGPGHNAVLFDKGKWFNIYHAYAASSGAPELRITEMAFDSDGWPIPHAP